MHLSVVAALAEVHFAELVVRVAIDVVPQDGDVLVAVPPGKFSDTVIDRFISPFVFVIEPNGVHQLVDRRVIL